MTNFRNLSEAAQADPAIMRVLVSGCEHEDAASRINSLSQADGYKTTESSVRRWRSKWLEQSETPDVDQELSEDVGAGMDLGDEENHVEPGWSGWGESDRRSIHDRLDAALDAVGAEPWDVAGLRVSTYQSLTKDAEGEAHIHDLYAVKLLVKTRDLTPAWPVVQPAHPTTVKLPPRSGRPMRGEQVAVILPDPQIGYRHYMDTPGKLDPFQDEAAIEVALQITRDVNPDLVIWLGDFFDFPAFGRYTQEAAFAQTTQAALDRGHALLNQARIAAPNARHVLHEGNHDRRLENMVVANAQAAFGLRQAAKPDSWPVLSVPHLARLDEMEIEYVGAYPAGVYWINDNLRTIHGFKVRSGGSTAAAVVRDDHVSTIFGHIHRQETHYITRQDRSGGKTLMAHSPGALCRIDGAVPSAKGSTDLTGRPVESYENWQQGLTIVRYEPGDGGFAIEPVFIDTTRGHKARYGGRIYAPNSGE